MMCKHCGYRHDAGTVGFKATCENCDEYLHSCLNCALFNPDTDRCRSLTTDAVSDRKSSNYCEEFVQNKNPSEGKDSAKAKSPDDFTALFGAEEK